MTGEEGQDAQRATEQIKRRVAIGKMVTKERLASDLEGNFNSLIVGHAINQMIKNGEFKEVFGNKKLQRIE